MSSEISNPAGGNYDDVCQQVLKQIGGKLVCVMVVEGNHGNGFSLSTMIDPRPLPAMLRDMADKIEANFKNATGLAPDPSRN